MINDAAHAAEVIDRVRSLYRRDTSDRESLDVNEIIREMIILLRDKVDPNTISISTKIDPGLPRITADRVQLQQVLMNLILNGIEAMSAVEDRKRDLIVRTQRGEGDHVRVAVQDSGVGFDPLNAERIFDAFHTTKPGGMGMGLSISRSIEIGRAHV